MPTAKRKAVSVLLTFAILASSFLPSEFSQVAYAASPFDDCGSKMNDTSKTKIPKEIRKNVKGMEINAALYNARIRDHQLMKMREKAGKYTSEGE